MILDKQDRILDANKGFEKLCKTVNDQFDNAIISLHIPFSHYCDTDGNQAKNSQCS